MGLLYAIPQITQSQLLSNILKKRTTIFKFILNFRANYSGKSKRIYYGKRKIKRTHQANES